MANTTTTMFMSSISNRKLHCSLITLILFILIFLYLPLLLIHLANTRYEEFQDRQANNMSKSVKTPSKVQKFGLETTTITAVPSKTTGDDSGDSSTWPQNPFHQPEQPLNCTQFAKVSNLSLVEENFKCHSGTFPCQSCPYICIEQSHICDGNAECPDRSDESSCHDSNGAMEGIFQQIASKKQHQSGSITSLFLYKPDSCSHEQFDEDRCPCALTESRVVICDGMGLEKVPNTLLSSVFKIRMSNNSISDIDNVLWPKELATLALLNNHITKISKNTFKSVKNLSKLYLSQNDISFIDPEAFSTLNKLTTLHLESNKLTIFDSKMLKFTPSIQKLYLSENAIELPEDTMFSHCRLLQEVLLDHNKISMIRSYYFSNMTKLMWLSLTHNQISFIEPGSFDWDYELEELNLSFNKIKVIYRSMFAVNLNIRRLHLGGNPLNSLSSDAFRELMHLKSLNLTHVDFRYMNNQTFSYLTQLEFIYFAKFRYCHYALHVRVCRPITDGLSSIEELLAFPILKYAVWIVAFVCSVGNVLVFIWRSVSSHEDKTLSLFVRNLSIADLMMGIYLGAIGWQDWKFQHHFGRHAIDWMSSWKCTAIGFLAILSSELSVFILTIITIERYRSIISIHRFDEKTLKQRARLYVTMAWLFSFLIAFYPIVEWFVKESDYYATNGLCLPLHIDQPFTPGWQYSAFIYLGINFLAVMIIIVLYVQMYAMIMHRRQKTRPVFIRADKHEDAILAVRFFFIVITDCLCWIPIVVIKIMALANVSISSAIYGWLVVFIIPINSALNPIVYTLAAPTSLRDAVCRLFERICYKLDKLTSFVGNNLCMTTLSYANTETHLSEKRRRKNTETFSSTCDTFETSIVSHNKGSSESTAIMLHLNGVQ